MANTKITLEELRHVAKLARIPLTEDQEPIFLTQLESILEHFDIINKTDTSKVDPTYQVTGLKNVTREDVVDEKRIFTQKQALTNAPRQQDGYFVVESFSKK
jgi:aspartyl-tRNA(Asn)/glutamyl-tRNA(Gln) amidotransferase subunit C